MKKTFFYIIMVMLLVSCSSYSEPTADIKIVSANYLNPDINGRASPAVLTFYQLSSVEKFKQASYQSLSHNPNRVLADDLLDKYSIEIRPDEGLELSQPISEDSRYLGITVAYRDISRSDWKKIFILPNSDNDIKVRVNLESQRLIANLKESHWYE